MFERGMRGLTTATEVVIIVILTVLSCLVFGQVFLRYLFGTALYFADELSRYLLVWLGFLGGSLGIRAGAHIGVELVWRLLSLPLQRVMAIIVALLALVFLVALTYGGMKVLPNQLLQLSPGLGVSMFWPYLAIPVGGTLMVLQLLEIVLRLWRGADRPDYLVEDEALGEAG